MIHVRHAATAIPSGPCETVLITHGEIGRSGVGRTRKSGADQPRRTLPSLSRKRGREGRGWVTGAADFVNDPGIAAHDLSRRPRESGGPGASDEAQEPWVPAFAGTTK
jgi:hypothetical protein